MTPWPKITINDTTYEINRADWEMYFSEIVDQLTAISYKWGLD